MRNVVLYGGSFDPPHWGHIDVLQYVSSLPQIDATIVTVCYQQKGKVLSPWADRYAMAVRAFGALPRVAVSDLEREMGGESLTLRTVQELRRQHPDVAWHLVVGADVAQALPLWEGGRELLEIVSPLVIARSGYEGGSDVGAAGWSSTEVRRAAARHDWELVNRACPPSVAQYVKETGLYCDCAAVTTPQPSAAMLSAAVVSRDL